MLHFRGGRAGISREAYPELEPTFYEDVARAYGEELRSLYDAGCRYVQMDDTNLAYLCDDKMREAARSRGDDPDELPHRYAGFINSVVAQKPAGMMLCMHLCRGNFKSTWAAQGGYEPVAEALLKEMNIDAYFLEYDDARSGDFRPLRFLPKGKTVVLGLVTTKLGELETKDDLKRRIDEAAKYVPLEQLGLSPAVRLLEHGARQQHRRRGAARQAARWWSRRRARCGTEALGALLVVEEDRLGLALQPHVPAVFAGRGGAPRDERRAALGAAPGPAAARQRGRHHLQEHRAELVLEQAAREQRDVGQRCVPEAAGQLEAELAALVARHAAKAGHRLRAFGLRPRRATRPRAWRRRRARRRRRRPCRRC